MRTSVIPAAVGVLVLIGNVLIGSLKGFLAREHKGSSDFTILRKNL